MGNRNIIQLETGASLYCTRTHDFHKNISMLSELQICE